MLLIKRNIMYRYGWILLIAMILPNVTSMSQSDPLLNDVYYVGGSGPGNFSSIQSAIDAAVENAIIYVFNESAPYHEHIQITKKVTLEGEDCDSTIIDGDDYGDVISIYAEQVIIHGFTIQHSGSTPMIDAGIELHANKCQIFDTIIRDNPGFSVGIYANSSSNHEFFRNNIFNMGNEGIYLQNSNGNTIYRNTIHHNGHCALVIDASQHNIIEYNTFIDNYATISLWPNSINNEVRYNTLSNSTYSGMGIWEGSNKNYVHHNLISNVEERGIILKETTGNKIINNIFKKCGLGIFINQSTGTIIKKNNFIENREDAGFYDAFCTLWWRNYWDTNTKRFFKRINGHIHLPWDTNRLMEWQNFDLFPALQPYTIETSTDRVNT